jgi:phosphomannomutase / phosphoglucomutase
MDGAQNNLFRAYDIRGIYGKDLTASFAERLGKALGTFYGEGKTVAVARDTRESGEILRDSLINGLTSVGCNVVDLGVFPTPSTALVVLEKGFEGGVVVSASHNTAEWNGFIAINSKGLICSEGFGMEEIKGFFSEQNFTKAAAVGKVTALDATNIYLDIILRNVHVAKKFRVVLDVRGGATYLIAPEAFSRVGCEITTINDTIDGRFSGQKPDVTEDGLTGLKKAVVEHGADVGIAFDADGDRAAFVDSKGRYCGSGNVTIALFSESYLQRNRDAKIVFDVCCSSFISEFITSKGGTPLVNRVGHSFIMNRMRQENAAFGGEYSNHLYFSEIFGLDDAIFAGLKLLEILSSKDRPLADLTDAIPKYPATNVQSISCPDEIKFQVIESLKPKIASRGYRTLDLDGIKAFTDDGWFIIRASNTNPTIKVNAEGKTEDAARELHAFAVDVVQIEIEGYPKKPQP